MENVLNDGLLAIEACQNLSDLQNVRNEFLSKKGLVQQLMGKMKDLSTEEKPAYGAQINQIKQRLEAAFKLKEDTLQEAVFDLQLQHGMIDLSLPSTKPLVGTLHPITIVQTEIEQFFIGMGYLIKEGPEVELDYYNFERANIPQDHPARDMQDTFYINADWLLRTHTTAIQTRTLEQYQGVIPVKVICPGKVYRKDDDDATHSHQFVQIEGLVVGTKISLDRKSVV